MIVEWAGEQFEYLASARTPRESWHEVVQQQLRPEWAALCEVLPGETPEERQRRVWVAWWPGEPREDHKRRLQRARDAKKKRARDERRAAVTGSQEERLA